MIESVIVPLDGSRLAASALAPARALAERAAASLLLMRCARDEEPEELQRYLDSQASDLGFDRVATRVVDETMVAEAILEQSRVPGAVVCMTTRGRGRVSRALLGSVVEAVLIGSDQPVLLVGPSLDADGWSTEHWGSGANAIVTIDGSRASEAILPAATEWTQLLGLQPWVVQVIEPAAGATPVPDEPGAESAAIQRAAIAMSGGGSAPQWDLLRGDRVVDAILDYAARLPASLIAMTTHGRTGLPLAALGSVAMNVVHGSPCPVLVVRPRFPAG